METRRYLILWCLQKEFKSYYVVWKLSWERRWDIVYALFKSYYVVWKLFWNIFEVDVLTMFKSYYVVWKPYDAPSTMAGYDAV